jgi:hypothetical protein
MKVREYWWLFAGVNHCILSSKNIGLKHAYWTTSPSVLWLPVCCHVASSSTNITRIIPRHCFHSVAYPNLFGKSIATDASKMFAAARNSEIKQCNEPSYLEDTIGEQYSKHLYTGKYLVIIITKSCKCSLYWPVTSLPLKIPTLQQPHAHATLLGAKWPQPHH